MPPRRSVPQTECAKLELKASQTTDKSLESTRRMANLCEESKEAGIRTLVALDDQGEQLDHIEAGMAQINEDMLEAEKNLDGLGFCCGLSLSCNKLYNFKKNSDTWKRNEDDGKIVTNQPQRVMANGMAYGGYIGRYTNDGREDEMETNMSQVSTMLGNLRDMAIDIGGEIETQTRQLNRINVKAESNDAKIQEANVLAGKILKI